MKKFDPLDSFLKEKLSQPSSLDSVDFNEFTHYQEVNHDSIDHWLNHELKDHTSKIDETDWLNFQHQWNRKEEEERKVFGWLKKVLNRPPLEQVSFQEFQLFNQRFIFKKWSKRLAILLLLCLATYVVQQLNIVEKHFSGNSNNTTTRIDLKKGLILSNLSNNQSKTIKENTTKKKFIHTNQAQQKIASILTQNHLNRQNLIKKIGEKEISIEYLNTSSQVQTLMNEFKDDHGFHKINAENIEALNPKKGSIQSHFVRNLEKSFDRKLMKSESYYQFSFTNFGAHNVFENDFENSKVNRHFKDLETNFSTFIQNMQIQYAYGWKYGLVFQGGLAYQQAYSKNHWEYHITDIPVIDSASNRIVGYVPLGPKGQVHVAKNTSFQTNSAIISGTIGKSLTIVPGLSLQFSTSLGLKYQRKYLAEVPDLTTLDLKYQSFAPAWSMVFTPQVSLNQRISKYWSIGGQVNWTGNVKKQDENYLNFKEKTIFGMGINIRYYPFESKFDRKK